MRHAQPPTPRRAAGRALLLASGLIAIATGAAATAAPASPVNGALPHFPLGVTGLAQSDGHVVLAVSVTDDGAVDDCLTLEASHEAFASAAEEAVKTWRYPPAAAAPAMKPRREVVQIEFRRNGVVSALSHAEAAAEPFRAVGEAGAVHTVLAESLPSPPQRVLGDSPRFTSVQAAQLASQPLAVSYLIDREGRVRLPTLAADVPMALADTVLSAVRLWHFQPVTVDGKAVVVQAGTRFATQR